MTAKYEALAQKIDNIESVEDIKAATTELNALKAYFFDDVRLEQVEGLKKRYLQLYDALTLTGKFVKRGQYSCQVLLKGRPVKVSTLPTVKSSSVTQLNVRPTTDGTFLVTYDDSECIEDEENTIDVMLRLDGKRLTYKISLTEAGSGFGSQKFSIAPEALVAALSGSSTVLCIFVRPIASTVLLCFGTALIGDLTKVILNFLSAILTSICQ